jgi:chlorobactene glucosyltransferase
MYMMTSMLLPLPLTTRTSAPGLSFAIGQFLAVNADDYTSTGGHAAISEQFQDDIKLARSFKASGKRVIFLDAKERVMCRMYIGFRESFRGISRNIFAYLDKNPAKLFGIYLLTFLGIFYPLGNLAASILRREPALLPAVTVILFATAWYLNLKDRGQDILSIFLYPITFLNLIIMGTYSMMKTGLAGAGIAWKGRQVK